MESLQDGGLLPTLDSSGSPSSLLETFFRQHETPPDRRKPNLTIISPQPQLPHPPPHCRDSPRHGPQTMPAHHQGRYLASNQPLDRPNSAPPPHSLIFGQSPTFNQIQPLTFSPLSRQMVSLNPFQAELIHLPERDSPSGLSPASSSRKKRRSSSGQCEYPFEEMNPDPDRGKRHSSAGETQLTSSLSQPSSFSLGGSGPERNKSFPSAGGLRDGTTSERRCCPPSTSNILCRAIVEQQALFQRQMQMIKEDQARLMEQSSKQTQSLVAAIVAKHIATSTSSLRRKMSHNATDPRNSPSSTRNSDSFAANLSREQD